MESIMDTLITDRVQADVDRARYLNSRWDARARRWTGTPEEWAEWSAGPRGAYGFNDMNRVERAVAYLTGKLSELGYFVDLNNAVPAYNIRTGIDPKNGGTASGGGTFYRDSEVSVSAQPGEKYDFVGWMEFGEIVSEALIYTFVVNRSRDLTAAFALKKFHVTASVDPFGAGEVTGAGAYDIDTEVTVAATAGEGYVFTRWIEDGETVAEGPQYTFILDRDRALSAVMTKTHVISVTSNDADGGTVSGSGIYLDGQIVTVTAAAGDGYKFARWSENGSTVSSEAVYSFQAADDRELVAVFVKTHVITLLVDPVGQGTAQGGGTFPEGRQITVTATPNEGYRFVHWVEDFAPAPVAKTVNVNFDSTAIASLMLRISVDVDSRTITESTSFETSSNEIPVKISLNKAIGNGRRVLINNSEIGTIVTVGDVVETTLTAFDGMDINISFSGIS